MSDMFCWFYFCDGRHGGGGAILSMVPIGVYVWN